MAAALTQHRNGPALDQFHIGNSTRLPVESQSDNGIDPDDTALHLSPHRKDALRALPFPDSPAGKDSRPHTLRRYLSRRRSARCRSPRLRGKAGRQHHTVTDQRIQRGRFRNQPSDRASRQREGQASDVSVRQPAKAKSDSKEPDSCTTSTKTTHSGGHVKIGFVKFGSSFALAEQEEKYVDPKTGEVKTRYSVVATDGATLAGVAGVGTNGEVNGSGLGADLSAEAGFDVKAGDTWEFNSKEEMEAFVKHYKDYRFQQEQLSSDNSMSYMEGYSGGGGVEHEGGCDGLWECVQGASVVLLEDLPGLDVGVDLLDYVPDPVDLDLSSSG